MLCCRRFGVLEFGERLGCVSHFVPRLAGTGRGRCPPLPGTSLRSPKPRHNTTFSARRLSNVWAKEFRVLGAISAAHIPGKVLIQHFAGNFT